MNRWHPAHVGLAMRSKLADLGLGARLFARLFLGSWGSWRRFGLIRDQIHFLGNYSLAIIAVSGLFVGFVFGLQGYYTLQRYGATEMLGTGLALTLLRELGPVVAALLFAGRACSSISADIGSMKASEQLSSMEMIGVDPLRRIVAPRLWAGIVSLPLLTIIFSAVGILGGKFVGVDWLGVDEGSFWSSMQGSVSFGEDVLNGIIKSVVFAVTCTWIAVYQGYACDPTPEGIATAITRTVVYSSLCVLGLDFVLTAVMFGGLS